MVSTDMDTRAVQPLAPVERKIVRGPVVNKQDAGVLDKARGSAEGGAPAVIAEPLVQEKEGRKKHTERSLVEAELERRMTEIMETYSEPKLDRMNRWKVFNEDTNRVRVASMMRVKAAKGKNSSSVYFVLSVRKMINLLYAYFDDERAQDRAHHFVCPFQPPAAGE